MRTADFDFALPQELIAQHPTLERDESRLLALNRTDGHIKHRRFREVVDFFHEGDVLVLNNSRVIPARLRGVNARTGGRFWKSCLLWGKFNKRLVGHAVSSQTRHLKNANRLS